MSRSGAGTSIRTYVPADGRDEELSEFLRVLESTSGSAPGRRPALVSADGMRSEVPEEVFQVLHQVADALSNGMGVTVAPMNAMLTTQEAADFLGIARPTLVRILERGELPMEKPGRHRLVSLRDLVAYQAARRQQTGSFLDQMITDAEAADLYDRTDGPAPATR